MHDIFALTTDWRDWRAGVRYAAGLAAIVRGSLTAAYASPLPLPTAQSVPELLASEIIDACRERTAAALRAEGNFTRWAEGLGVDACRWHVVEGTAEDTAAAAAKWHDVLVLERDSGAPWSTPEQIGRLLVAVDAPCIVVPGDVHVARFSRIVVAWNGSHESVRALRSALPLLRRAAQVFVLHARDDDSINPLSRAQAYLAEKGVHVHFHALGADDESIGEAIATEATRRSADMLVMGAYGRPRLAEQLLGGVTRHLLERARIPLFMHH